MAKNIVIIVPTFNRSKTLQEFINSIDKSVKKSSRIKVYIYICDDYTKGVNEYISENCTIKYLKTSGDEFWTGAVIFGLENIEVDYDYLIIANDDVCLLSSFDEVIEEFDDEAKKKKLIHAMALSQSNGNPTVVGYRKKSNVIHFTERLYKKSENVSPDFLITRFLVTNLKIKELIKYIPEEVPQYHADLILTNCAKRNGVELSIGKFTIGVKEAMTAQYPKRYDFIDKYISLAEIRSRNFLVANKIFYKKIYGEKYYHINILFWMIKLCIR
jgi:glycosyltransferase involved in cell wall biosynthesis